MSDRKYSWTLPLIHDPIHEKYLKTEGDKQTKEKIKDLWKNGSWIDIFSKTTEDGDKIIAIVKRISQEDYDKYSEEDKVIYSKEMKRMEYTCTYPHSSYEGAREEYNLWKTVYEFDADDCFSKTEYFSDREYIWFERDRIKYRSLEKGHLYSNKDYIFRTLMYRNLRKEALKN